jgi:hypothetical protein
VFSPENRIPVGPKSFISLEPIGALGVEFAKGAKQAEIFFSKDVGG